VFDHPLISTVGLITAGRPTSARRSLHSLVHHCDLYGHRPRFLVIDGSKEPADQAATRSAVSDVADVSGHQFEYVGTKEAKEFCAMLAVPDEIDDIATVLAPGSSGANRNLLFLMTSGEHVLTFDDDVVCETWAASNSDDGLALMGHHQELLETAFFPSRATALGTVARTAADLFAAHAALLGRALPTLIAESPRPVDLTGGCAHLRSALEERRPLVVKATFAGLAGDAGVYCPYRLLFSAGPLRQLLRSSPRAFQIAMASREASRIVRTNVVTHDCGCMAFCMGVANREVVPPFMPIGRNEDGAFGVMLAAFDPATVFGHVPVGVLHDSNRPSERAGEPISATESRLSDLVISVVRRSRFRSKTTSCETWLQEMGQSLMDIGHRDERGLAAFVTDVILGERSLELEQLVKDSSGSDCPEHWRAAVGKYRDQLSNSMTTREFFLPAEFHALGSVDAGYRALQTFFLTFGRLLASWPALWVAARRLNPNAQ
jgi:hypothetical protein